MFNSNKEQEVLLYLIQQQIPEFDAQPINRNWMWIYRGEIQQSETQTLVECFIDFAATLANAASDFGLVDDE